MSRNEANVKQRADEASQSPDTSFASLSKTLEDLEKRLSRLSGAKVTPADRPAETGSSVVEKLGEDGLAPSERLRAMTEARRARRPSLSSAVSSMTVERQLSSDVVSQTPAPKAKAEPKPRTAPRASAIERRFGTIAGEVEQIQMQGTAIGLIKELASELAELRGDIQARSDNNSEERFAEIQASFADLKQMIVEHEGPDRIGAEIFEIMESLTELTAGTADQASIDALRSELDSVAVLVGQMAREESLEAVQRRWDAFETQIADRMELDLQAKRDLKVELERLRGSLRSLATEEQILAVQQRWEEFEARYVDTARLQAEESLTSVLRGELDGLRAKLDLIVAETSGDAMDARFEAMADRFSTDALEAGVERLSDRMGEIELALVGLPEILQIDQMEQRIQALAEGVETLAREIREPDLDHLAVVEERLDEISAALVAATLDRRVELDMAPIERIEARVADLANRVDRLVESGDAEILSVQIAALAERIEDIGTKGPQDDIGRRIDMLSERVETLFRSAAAPDMSALEARLTSLAQRLDESAATKGVDNEVIQALEAQIGRLAEHLAGAPGLFGDENTDVSRRLEAIERQLDENRDNVVAAARAAADEAVRRMQDEDVRRESGFVRELAQDLRNLETLCRESDERTFGVFDAVHTTLLKIVERLTLIERELRVEGADGRPVPKAGVSEDGRVEWAVSGVDAAVSAETEPKGLRAAIARHMARRGTRAERAGETPTLAERVHPTPIVEAEDDAPVAGVVEPEAKAATPVLEAPTLDAAESMVSREANRPLEPGSGAPDIAALIERVRQQQRGVEAPAEPLAKADFIAAARKAAMAAAAEAEALRDKEDAPGEAGSKDRSGRRRKPILMAVGAVLLALMAMPLGRAYLEPATNDPAEPTAVASIDAPAEPAIEPAVPQPVAPAETTPVDAAPEAPAAQLPVEPNAASTETAALAEPSAPVAAPAVPEIAAPEFEGEPPVGSIPAQTADAGEAPVPVPVPVPVQGPAAATVDAAATNVADAATLLASAQSRLPEAAKGGVPGLPEGMASPALQKAVEAGEPMALFEIGLRLMEGRNAPSDPTTALTWFAKSGERGFAPAQYSLGTLYEKGNGVGRDTGAARDWYQLAAEQGNVRAMHNLAVLYATGIEGKSDPKAAAEWFVRAAEHGMRDSQYNLGILYARGAGVEQDLASSYRWFSIVSRTGDKDAEAKMGEVGKTLTDEQRGTIDAEVADWKPAARNEAANTVEIPADWSDAAGKSASVDMTRAIRNVQAILIKLGYNPGQPDGVAGAQTETAIREFQEKSGLQATGKIDEPLIRALLERKDA